MHFPAVILCLLPFLCVALSQGDNCKGQPNQLPLYTSSPTLIKTVPNGKLFVTGASKDAAFMTADMQASYVRPYVIHVYGTPYEMGKAHGMLLKDEITEMYTAFRGYVASEVNSAIKTLPKWLRELIETKGVDAALEVTYLLTKPYIHDYMTQEVQGLADAVGQSLEHVMGLLLFPELIQAHCSMMGAWGDSIKNTVGAGSLYQLRALDWGTSSPLQKYPAVLVYHPTAPAGAHSLATLTWVGFLGALTGFSSKDVAVCEKVWLHYKGKQNRAGIPWHFLLRDILMFDTSVPEALERINSAKRTCSIFVGLGGSETTGAALGSNLTFRAVEYAYEGVTVFNDHNMANHTQFHDLVYVDKHTQPSSDPCLPSLIKQHYGNLNSTVIFREITARFQTGDMHLAVFDFNQHLMYFANAGVAPVNGSGVPAYNMPFTRLNLTAAFIEPQPHA